ncbi:MAG: arginine--tRNA ligase [Patescibacteria group bacterium]
MDKTLKTILEEAIGRRVVWDSRFGVYAVYCLEEEADKIGESKKTEKYFSYTFASVRNNHGFLNFKPTLKGIEHGLKFALQGKFNFPSTSLGTSGKKVQVEFISANPTGPLTLGNGRGGVYGDVLANILEKAGRDVEKEYYVNDTGGQVEILGHSVLKDDKAEYKGEYIDELNKKFSEGDPKEIGEKSAEIILESIKKTVASMGINFDVWFSEKKDLRDKGKVDEIINWFKEKDLTYEKDDALWFKASEFGDREDRVLVKKDGEPTYFAVDCAYHKNKFEERKFDKVINVWGADHHGDVARMNGFVEALGYKDNFEIVLMQFVRLMEKGETKRMSKRKGVFVLVDDVLKEIGKDAFRYFMLTRSSDTHMDFDLELAKEQSKKNPVYYIQYAGARMQNILEKSRASNLKSKTISNIEILNSKHEKGLVLKLIQFPEIIEDISKSYQVHQLATYAYELAKIFTDFYENVRVLETEDGELKTARLELVAISRQVLGNVLKIMGVSSPKKM